MEKQIHTDLDQDSKFKLRFLNNLVLFQNFGCTLPTQQKIIDAYISELKTIPNVTSIQYIEPLKFRIEKILVEVLEFQYHFNLNTMDNDFGELILISKTKLGSDYHSIIENVCSYLSVLLENNYQKEILKEDQLNLRDRKLNTLNTFIKEISHDFNNIFGVILGFAEMSLSNSEMILDEEEIQDNIEEIILAANRGKALINEMMEFSHRKNKGGDEIKVDELIKSSVRFAKRFLGSQIEFKFDCKIKSPIFIGKTIHFHQIMINLIQNSIQAIGSKEGKIHIILEQVSRDNIRDFGIKLSKFIEKYFHIQLFDNGIGIPQENLENLFDPLFTTKDEAKGLGLVKVYNIIKSYAGEVFINSIARRGTEVHIFLPCDEACKTQPRSIQKIKKNNKFAQIAIIDDEEPFRKMIHKILTHWDYNSVTYASFPEFLADYNQRKIKHDLVLMDYNMQPINGILGAKQLRKLEPNLPIVLITGSAYVLSQNPDNLQLFNDVLYKPIKNEELLNKIQNLVIKSGKKI